MYDEDGIREVKSIAESDKRRRQIELDGRDSVKAHQNALRAAFASGEMTMAEYAKQAREAGISASEVGAALQERAQQERRMSQEVDRAKSDAANVETNQKVPELTAALAAKAQGLERLRLGHSAPAVDAFDDGAMLAEKAEASLAQEQDSVEAKAQARAVRTACLLNAALCQLKLEEWSAAEAACTSVVDLDGSCAKAYYRRGTARLQLGRLADAIDDLVRASGLTPGDKEIKRLLSKARSMMDEERAATAPHELNAASTPAAPVLADAKTEERPTFLSASAGFQGFRAGYAFKHGELGLGYYLDPLAPDVRPVATVEGTPSVRLPDVSARRYCFLEVSIDGHLAGRLTIQLFHDLVPRTVGNFLALISGRSYTAGCPCKRYAGSPFHRIAKGFMLQGGDVVAGNGSGSVSGLDGGELFEDESFAIPHTRPGVLSMANSGPNSNGCQFFITLAAISGCDGKHVAFGRLVAGWALLRRIEALSVNDKDEPLEPVLIAECGELNDDEAAKYHETFTLGDGDAGPLDMGGEALLKAASEGDLLLMRQLIERGVPVDAFGCISAPVLLSATDTTVLLEPGAAQSSEDEEETLECAALAVAARLGNMDMLRGLLQCGADPDLVDSSGRCAIHWAVMCGHASCVKVLLTAGAEPSAVDGVGRSALHMAAARGQIESMRCLLEHYKGVPDTVELATAVNTQASGLTPLHLAAAADHPECISELLSAGAEKDLMAAAELSPLHLAAGQGALMALATLLAAGADPAGVGERSQRSALHTACEHNQPMAVAALLAGRADVTALDVNGSSPLHWASKSGAHDVITCLLAARASVHAVTRTGSSALHLACEAASPKCVALLLRSKANCDELDAQSIRPLHAASAAGSVECLQLLLAEGADAEAALHIQGAAKISENLSEAHTKTPLYLAAEKGHAGIVKILVAAKVSVDALAVTVTEQTTSRTSALWAARRGGHDAVIQLLMDAGAHEIALTTANNEENQGQLV